MGVTRVAIVGAGNMAAEHIKALWAVEGVEIAGVYSRTKERAAKLAADFSIPVVCDSVDELHSRTSAQLVVVAVSELSTREVTAKCFEYPWTLLIEKPAGYDVADAEAISAAAKAGGRRAYVALNRRHYSSTRSVVADLLSDAGPRFIHIQDQEDPRAALAAGRPGAIVDNWMYANSIHLIDYLTVLGRGSITSVDRVQPWTPENPAIVIARIGFDSGDVGLYQAVWNRPGPWAIAVTTPTKRWEMRPVEEAAVQVYPHRKLEPAAKHEWDIQFKPGLRAQAGLAVKAARGEPTPELPTIDDALVSMRLTRSIYSPL